jgi:hypothetical protein
MVLNLMLDHPEAFATDAPKDRFGGPDLYRWRGFLQ